MTFSQLTMFEGHEPSALTFSCTGKITEHKDQPTRDLKLGETIVVLCVGKLDHVGFDDADPGPVRNHKFKVEQAFEVPADEATELLKRLYHDNFDRGIQLGLVDEDAQAKAS